MSHLRSTVVIVLGAGAALGPSGQLPWREQKVNKPGHCAHEGQSTQVLFPSLRLRAPISPAAPSAGPAAEAGRAGLRPGAAPSWKQEADLQRALHTFSGARPCPGDTRINCCVFPPPPLALSASTETDPGSFHGPNWRCSPDGQTAELACSNHVSSSELWLSVHDQQEHCVLPDLALTGCVVVCICGVCMYVGCVCVCIYA